MYKAAVLGNYNSIYAFAALGLDVIGIDSPQEALKFIYESNDSGYALIYITEDLLEDAQIAEFAAKSDLPVIIPIPSTSGESGKGMARIKKIVEQAVGSDIIFND